MDWMAEKKYDSFIVNLSTNSAWSAVLKLDIDDDDDDDDVRDSNGFNAINWSISYKGS